MKSGKKLLLVLLCLVIASLLFAGGASEVENGDNLSAYELKDPRPTLKMLMSPSTYDYNERPEAAEIEELTGYKVEYYLMGIYMGSRICILEKQIFFQILLSEWICVEQLE